MGGSSVFQIILVFPKNSDEYKSALQQILQQYNNKTLDEVSTQYLSRIFYIDNIYDALITQQWQELPNLYSTDPNSFAYIKLKELLVEIAKCKNLAPDVNKHLYGLIAQANQYNSVPPHIIPTAISLLLHSSFNVDSVNAAHDANDAQLPLEEKRKIFYKYKWKVEKFLCDQDITSCNLIEELSVPFNTLKKLLNHPTNRTLRLQARAICQEFKLTLDLPHFLNSSIEGVTYECSNMENGVLVVGYTGAGRSTLINYLTGTAYDLKHDKARYRKYLQPKIGQKAEPAGVGHKSYESKTLYLQVIKHNDFAYYDCPYIDGAFHLDTINALATIGFPLAVRYAQNIRAIVVVTPWDTICSCRGPAIPFIEELVKIMPYGIKQSHGPIPILLVVSKPPETLYDEYYNADKLREIYINKINARMEEEFATHIYNQQEIAKLIRTLDDLDLTLSKSTNFAEGKIGRDKNVLIYNRSIITQEKEIELETQKAELQKKINELQLQIHKAKLKQAIFKNIFIIRGYQDQAGHSDHKEPLLAHLRSLCDKKVEISKSSFVFNIANKKFHELSILIDNLADDILSCLRELLKLHRQIIALDFQIICNPDKNYRKILKLCKNACQFYYQKLEVFYNQHELQHKTLEHMLELLHFPANSKIMEYRKYHQLFKNLNYKIGIVNNSILPEFFKQYSPILHYEKMKLLPTNNDEAQAVQQLMLFFGCRNYEDFQSVNTTVIYIIMLIEKYSNNYIALDALIRITKLQLQIHPEMLLTCSNNIIELFNSLNYKQAKKELNQCMRALAKFEGLYIASDKIEKLREKLGQLSSVWFYNVLLFTHRITLNDYELHAAQEIFAHMLDYLCSATLHPSIVEQLTQTLLKKLGTKKITTEHIQNILSNIVDVYIKDINSLEYLTVLNSENFTALNKVLDINVELMLEFSTTIKDYWLLLQPVTNRVERFKSFLDLLVKFDILTSALEKQARNELINKCKNYTMQEFAILENLVNSNSDNIESALFNNLAFFLSTIHQSDSDLIKAFQDVADVFYKVTKECNREPNQMIRHVNLNKLFTFDIHQDRITKEQRLLFMYLVNNQVFVTEGYTPQAYQWSHDHNDALMALCLEKYVDESKAILSTHGNYMNTLQKSNLLMLAAELKLIGQSQYICHTDRCLLRQELNNIMDQYKSVWFKSSARQGQIQDIHNRLNTLNSDASSTHYEEILKAINAAKIDAMISDIKISMDPLRFIFNKLMNRSSRSRYFDTLNQMQDAVLKHWIQKISIDNVKELQAYETHYKKELDDLLGQVYCALQTHILKTDLVTTCTQGQAGVLSKILNTWFGIFGDSDKTIANLKDICCVIEKNRMFTWFTQGPVVARLGKIFKKDLAHDMGSKLVMSGNAVNAESTFSARHLACSIKLEELLQDLPGDIKTIVNEYLNRYRTYAALSENYNHEHYNSPVKTQMERFIRTRP